MNCSKMWSINGYLCCIPTQRKFPIISPYHNSMTLSKIRSELSYQEIIPINCSVILPQNSGCANKIVINKFCTIHTCKDARQTPPSAINSFSKGFT